MKKISLLLTLFGSYCIQLYTADDRLVSNDQSMLEKKSKRQERREKKQELQRIKQQQEELEDREILSFSEENLNTLPMLAVKNTIEGPKKVSFYSFPLVFTPEGINSFFNHSFNRLK